MPRVLELWGLFPMGSGEMSFTEPGHPKMSHKRPLPLIPTPSAVQARRLRG